MKTVLLFCIAMFFTFLSFSQSPPIAVADSASIIPGHSITLDVLANDIDPDGDSIFIAVAVGGNISDGVITYEFPFYQYGSYQGPKTFRYFISDDPDLWYNSFDTGYVHIEIINENFDSLNVNNINARFNSFGNHFWDLDGQARFFAPNGSAKVSVFSNTLWIGGLDDAQQLHLAAERYRQVGMDFWSGPISNVYDSLYDVQWNYMWKLNKTEIQFHRDHYNDPGYEPINDILSWPANGDESLGQAAQLAPFQDWNGNGIYEPMLGEYPRIKGDQTLFFIFNDARDIHTETQGIPLGIEIHGMAYAYDQPEDSALWNTIFMHYDIINRSDTTYNETRMGMFTDLDLGYWYDDYIGCDVQRGGYFAYNGLAIDGSGEPQAYGEHPPAMGVLFLGGPYLDPDDEDNPRYDEDGLQICNESINGLNFGDTIIDNERFGMTKFVYFNSGGGSYYSDPQIAPEYYKFLKGIWKDDISMQYGGNGHPISGALGPDCSFMFPGDSDSCNWGTNGIPPNGGLNTPGNYWTEEAVGNAPNDRRGTGSSGPFTFVPGAKHELDVAFVFARDFDGTPWSSVELLKERFDYIRDLFVDDPDLFSGIIHKKLSVNQINIYPNPMIDKLSFDLEMKQEGYYQIYSIAGILLMEGELTKGTHHEIEMKYGGKGMFIIKVNGDERVYISKFLQK
jgi:hypothetical protein